MGAPVREGPPRAGLAVAALGGLVGGLVGALVVIAITLALKSTMERVASQAVPALLAVPIVGLALTVLVLHALGLCGADSRAHRFRTFPPGAIQADITGDVVDTAGEEERFQWRLAPIRALATWATVGLGAGMGTEAPAAYFGVAAGACLGDRGRWWRKLIRPAALAGGAAGVAALMGIPLVGTAYLLELGRRHGAPLSVERVTAAVIGGIVGWGIDAILHLSLIRLVVPHEPPHSFGQAAVTALFIGVLSGGITALAGVAIYRAKKWHAHPALRLLLGGLGALAAAATLVVIAAPAAAVGPGGGAILWAESANALPRTLLWVALLRAVCTISAVAAGGCGGIFVPFLAIGDLAGRVFAPGLRIGDDLSAAAGAAGGISGGYRLPFTAVAMVLGVGGPRLSTLTCLATVAVAFAAGSVAERLVAGLARLPLWHPLRRGDRHREA
jgi:H+/Cl- antiporter ClcA